ncbi:brain-specific angiogenesis inhibitor 1-associated protein 2-like protein 2 isoform X2 [Pseudoliparis swirei]|uniref:brain-specific angiogenesis inhibitor 1-associated protein 2-like protein 2 isoform X2 n=1 Tax=Pseudoliparis swirei TaxID=2059687 RepID=UPI0024BE2AB4|nr:brain-specific angiogenesis inhibitor 1-associated protein 2-like protein 2 isoform X2 [Pseudoliparis swirei]
MSGMTSDQLHRSTLSIYSTLMDEFNPSLQELVSLGHSYVHAFQTLAVTSEAYFSALSKIGENTFHTISSRSMGDVLIQISESQRRLMVELDGAVHSFRTEVLQEMDSNIRLDKGYISGSRTHYETEVHEQAAALERQLRKGHKQDCSEYMQFLRESHSEALKEEERRYRFLSEKHCGLMRSIARIMKKTGGSLQQTAEAWSREVDATRGPEARRPADVINSMGMREEEVTRSREEQPLGNVPSRAPSPQGSISRPPAVRTTRARVAHQPGGSKPTMLPFNRGEIITVLVQQPRNGWLYGRADSSSREGWFPVTYVEALDDPPKTTSSGSMSDLLSQPESSSHSGAPPPAPPLSSYKQDEMPAITKPEKRTESNSEHKRSKPHASQPELFPRGTNPFATVKLKPTSTDDRSTPRVHRR